MGLRVWARVRVRARCLRLRGPRVVLLEARGAAKVLVGLLALRVYARARGVPDALDARRRILAPRDSPTPPSTQQQFEHFETLGNDLRVDAAGQRIAKTTTGRVCRLGASL